MKFYTNTAKGFGLMLLVVCSTPACTQQLTSMQKTNVGLTRNQWAFNDAVYQNQPNEPVKAISRDTLMDNPFAMDYYLIVGVFNKYTKARDRMTELLQQGFEVKIMEKKNNGSVRFYVHLPYYKTRKITYDLLSAIRCDFEDAWYQQLDSFFMSGKGLATSRNRTGE